MWLLPSVEPRNFVQGALQDFTAPRYPRFIESSRHRIHRPNLERLAFAFYTSTLSRGLQQAEQPNSGQHRDKTDEAIPCDTSHLLVPLLRGGDLVAAL
jgi:hypothetical protein